MTATRDKNPNGWLPVPDDDIQVYEEVCPKGKEKLFRWSWNIHEGDTKGDCIFEDSVLHAERDSLYFSRSWSLGGAGQQSAIREYMGYEPCKTKKPDSAKDIKEDVAWQRKQAIQVFKEIYGENYDNLVEEVGWKDSSDTLTVRSCLKSSKTCALPARTYIVDSGAGLDLIQERDLTKAEKKRVQTLRVPQPVITANGETLGTKTIQVALESGEIADALILKDTPAVLSLGKRCVDQGYDFHWCGSQNKNPVLITPQGKEITLVVENYVPIIAAAQAGGNDVVNTVVPTGPVVDDGGVVDQPVVDENPPKVGPLPKGTGKQKEDAVPRVRSV